MIKIAKSDLENALKVVSNTVNNGGSDISTHYVFRVKSGVLSLLSYKDKVFSSCPVVATTDGDVVFTAEGKRVDSLLKAVSAGSVLTFDPKGSEVVVGADRGKLEFAGLDPSLFPFWDEVQSEAQETAKISAKRLKEAFDHASMFIHTDEGRAPQLCVAEFRDGCLFATDQTAVSTIKVAGMEKASIRVYGKDVPSLVSFLDQAKETEVTVLEHDRALFIVRADGAVFGESRFGTRFPDFAPNWDQSDDHEWTIFKEEYMGSVQFLSAAASYTDSRIVMDRKDSSTALLTMFSPNGKSQTVDLKLSKAVSNSTEGFPEGGFAVVQRHLGRTIQSHGNTQVTLGISKRNKGGWVRVREDRGPDVYVTTIAWTKRN